MPSLFFPCMVFGCFFLGFAWKRSRREDPERERAWRGSLMASFVAFMAVGIGADLLHVPDTTTNLACAVLAALSVARWVAIRRSCR